MQLSNNIPELDRTGLQKFGLITGAIIVCLFGIAIPWLFDMASPSWAWILSVLLVIWAILAPSTLKPVYRLWMRFGLLMNKVTTPIILGSVFFLIITPMGIFMRIIGHDIITRKFDKSSNTYRIKSHTRTKQSMKRPF